MSTNVERSDREISERIEGTGPGVDRDPAAGGMERRDFLKVLGVAGAGAAATGCATEPDRLLPYLVQPEQTVPGTATYYRTTCRECPAGCGMTIRTREGRAVKAEGSPASPISHGKLCARGQASLHGLYDPDRIPQALVRDGDSWSRVSWDRAEQSLAEALAGSRGRAVFLTRPEPGSMDRLLDEWCEAMGVRRVKFDSFAHEPIRAAHRRLYGQDLLPVHDFSRADVVLSFGADFMETWLSPVDYSHGFVEGHAYASGHKGRFIAVTPHQSLTDLNADEWIAPRPGTEHLVALALARLVADEAGGAGSAAAIVADVDPAAMAEAAGVDLDRLRLAADAFAHGRALAVGPGVGTTTEAATTLAVAVAALNEVAGSVGDTVRLVPADEDQLSYGELATLLDELATGQVSTLLVRGPNPLYDLPDHDRVAEALAAVPFVASFSTWLDETSAAAHLLLPDHHFLESWGDYQPRPGTHSLVQPVMTPVFETKQTGDVLLSVARRGGAAMTTRASTYYDYLREQWRELQGRAGGSGTFDEWWTRSLGEGVVLTDESVPASGMGGDPGELVTTPARFDGEGELHLVVYPSYRFYDGRLANRPWLQELPDPVSKHTWGTVLEMNPATADEYGLDDGHLVELSTAHGTVELPVWRHPGVRADTVAIQLGQGHEKMGRYARDRGVNAMRLLGPRYDAESGALAWVQTMAEVVPTGRWERQPFSSTQDDVSGRHLLQTVTLEEALAADRSAALGAVPVGGEAHAGEGATAEGPGGLVSGPPQEHGEAGGHAVIVHPNDAEVNTLQESGGFAPIHTEASPQAYPPPGTHYGEYSEEHPRWAMAVDLERCIGCSACQTACVAENNIGIVGPELVAQGRLIQWMRIERYFEETEEVEVHEMDGGAEHRKVTFLPMMCQQCGNAPCEPVCPVYASYHTPDGLNGQIYNRCVGTRYCANNCPYKVRYFNYFNYEWPEPLNWQLNPDVTVREKGIMEKCTFCVQRIRDAEHHARVEGRYLNDGEITPACAQTCPGNAIVFGNIEDSNSRVAQVVESNRGFRVFEELNTQSAVVYLKKVTEGGEGAAH